MPEYVSPFRKFCEEKGVTCNAYGPIPTKDDSGWEHNAWKVELRYRGKQLITDYRMGLGLVERAIPSRVTPYPARPRAADVLASLFLDVSGGDQSFEAWCDEFGYNTDSRTALATYEACKATMPKLRALLGDDFDAFAEASREH